MDVMDVFIWDNNVSVETNYNHWKHMNDKEHRDYDEEVYSDKKSWKVFEKLIKRGKTSKNGIFLHKLAFSGN